MHRHRIAIAGGGLLGMTIALRAAQRGADVTIFEAAPALGGLADAWEIGDLRWDRHYHVTLLSDGALRGVLRELDLDREIDWVTTRTGFFTDGRFHSMSDTLEFLRFPPLGLVDKLRLGLTIAYGARIKDGVPLEGVLVEPWLRGLSGSRTFEKIWRPLLRAKLGDRYGITSASFIWAIITRLYAARRSGLKRELFGYVPGGYARVLERFEAHLRALGVRVVTGRAVREIASDGTGARLTLADGTTHPADAVVATFASPLIARVMPMLRTDERERLTDKIYQGIVCVSLVLDRPLGPYYVTNITDGWVPFTAVIDMSALVKPGTFGDRALAYLPKYVEPDDPLFERTDDEIVAEYVAALARMYPDFTAARVVASRVSRVRYVFPIATLAYSARVPAMRTSLPGVFVATSAQIVNGTLNANETVGLAERAVAELFTATALEISS